MNFSKALVALAVVFSCLWLSGCVARSEYVERQHLSDDIRQRVGHPLRANTVATNQLPPDVEISDGISADEAVAIALWNNPLFQENLSKLGLARADLAQAGMLSNPTFSILFPLGPKQLEFAATFPLEALWLRPRRVVVARFDAGRVADGLVQNGLDLVRDVHAGLSDLELARDRMSLGCEAVVLRERIGEITGGRQRAGEGSELEMLAARAEVARARDDVHRAEQDLAMLEERLLHLLGLMSTVSNGVFNPVAPVPAPVPAPVSLADLERRALAARPDLRASELAVEAAGRRAGLARAEIFALSGIIDANASGKEGFEIGPGLQLPIPILNQNQAGRTRATAEIERAAWNYLGTRQRVTLEVREAHARYQQASESLSHLSLQLVPALEELVRRSQKAYELGELSPLAVQENIRQLLAARLRQAELAADLRRARAELERSIGTRLSTDAK
jgi:cobalt-zinc-cadmium efflux system outer membrane protein